MVGVPGNVHVSNSIFIASTNSGPYLSATRQLSWLPVYKWYMIVKYFILLFVKLIISLLIMRYTCTCMWLVFLATLVKHIHGIDKLRTKLVNHWPVVMITCLYSTKIPCTILLFYNNCTFRGNIFRVFYFRPIFEFASEHSFRF